MLNPTRLIFIHGSDSSSRTYKAGVLRRLFPEMLTPDFEGDLSQRMRQLEAILGREKGWTVIGSSLGGLMGARLTCRHPSQVRKLVLLAPALMIMLGEPLPAPVAVPVVLVHGTHDEVVPPEPVRKLAEQLFTQLTYIRVDDDHRLHKTADKLDWGSLLA
jgi:pimeloyl-ACP methyl ester carboxylesterase